MRGVWCGLIVVVSANLAGLVARIDEPGAGEAIVTDVDGHEHRLAGLRFTTGTKHLAWLADPQGITEDAKRGPMALEFRELKSTTLVRGVVTLIPLSTVESARYDYEKQVATISVNGLAQPLMGSLEFRGINALGLTGTSEGKPLSVTGGVAGKAAVKSVVFNGAQVIPKSKGGMTWSIQIVQPKADNPTLTARNLKVLYAFPGGVERLVDGIPTRKGQPVLFNESLKRFELVANDLNTNFAAAEVESAGSPEQLVAIPLTLEQDRKTGTLLGILGEVDAGWKLFPLHTIKTITPSKRKVE